MPAAPRGLTVDTRRHALEDGPYRAATLPLVVAISYPPVHEKPSVPVRTVALAPLIAVLAVVAGVFSHNLVLLTILSIIITFFIVLAFNYPKPPPPLRALTIAEDHIAVAGEQLRLADVRRIEHVSAPGPDEVVVVTDDRRLVVARTADPVHARYIADRIDDAYRAFLRRGTRS